MVLSAAAAVVGGSLLEQHQLGFAEAGDQQGLLNDPAAVTAATAAAAAAAAASGTLTAGPQGRARWPGSCRSLAHGSNAVTLQESARAPSVFWS